jgi:hypothetical protein
VGQEKEDVENKPKIRGAIMMANSYSPKTFEGGTKVTVIPTWGFDAGTEYSFENTENFEIAHNLIYENKNEVYDT